MGVSVVTQFFFLTIVTTGNKIVFGQNHIRVFLITDVIDVIDMQLVGIG